MVIQFFLDYSTHRRINALRIADPEHLAAGLRVSVAASDFDAVGGTTEVGLRRDIPNGIISTDENKSSRQSCWKQWVFSQVKTNTVEYFHRVAGKKKEMLVKKTYIPGLASWRTAVVSLASRRVRLTLRAMRAGIRVLLSAPNSPATNDASKPNSKIPEKKVQMYPYNALIIKDGYDSRKISNKLFKIQKNNFVSSIKRRESQQNQFTQWKKDDKTRHGDVCYSCFWNGSLNYKKDSTWEEKETFCVE